MALPATWVAVDIIGTRLGNDVVIHSAGGQRVARPLARCANRLGFDRRGEDTFRRVVTGILAGRPTVVPGVVIEHHLVTAPDNTEVGLIIWVADKNPSAAPAYNAWMLGDGHAEGDKRAINAMLAHLNPDDAWSIVGCYYDFLTAAHGELIDRYWSQRPNGGWVHQWFSARVIVNDGARTLYGLTVVLKQRPAFESNILSLVKFTDVTMLLVEAKHGLPVTSVGRMAPLSHDRVRQVLGQIDLAQLTESDEDGREQPIVLDGEPFTAAKFTLRSTRQEHGDPVAIVLLPAVRRLSGSNPPAADAALV